MNLKEASQGSGEKLDMKGNGENYVTFFYANVYMHIYSIPFTCDIFYEVYGYIEDYREYLKVLIYKILQAGHSGIYLKLST